MSTVDLGAVPVPCLRCGAAMIEEASPYLHGDIFVRCAFCGAREPLPRDAAERVRLLRLRLMQLRNAEKSTDPARMMQALDAKTWGVAMVFVVLPVAATLSNNFDVWREQLRAARAAATFDVALAFVAAVVPSLVPVGVVVGLGVGFFAMRRVFYRAVRPAFLARPSIVPGSPARCRTCRGPLAASTKATSVACPYCGAVSFLGNELTDARAALLEAEAEEHRRRASGVARDLGSKTGLARAFYLFGALGMTVTMLVVAGSLFALVLVP